MMLHLLKRWRRPFFIGFAVLLALWLVGVAVLAIAIHSFGHNQRPQSADVIIVLGAGLRRDGRPGPALTRRTLLAAQLYREGYAPVLLCTGAQADGYPRSEASACRDVLLAQGIPPQTITLEETSRSTEENALYARQIMDERGWARALIVSDSYHLLRARWLFDRQRIPASFAAVPAEQIPPPVYTVSLAREIVAFHWLVFKDAFQLPMTYVYGL